MKNECWLICKYLALPVAIAAIIRIILLEEFDFEAGACVEFECPACGARTRKDWVSEDQQNWPVCTGSNGHGSKPHDAQRMVPMSEAV